MLDLGRSVLGPEVQRRGVAPARWSTRSTTRTLAEARHTIVVPAVNVTRSLTKVFKTPHGAASRGDETVRAVDVAMATSAAPAYFPAVRIGDALYADGGMFAVAPDQVALHEAEHFMKVERVAGAHAVAGHRHRRLPAGRRRRRATTARSAGSATAGCC